MKKTFKGTLALAFCIVTVFATMIVAAAIGAPKVKVGTVTYNSVSLSWGAVSNADYYEIQRSTDGKNWTSLSTSNKSTSYKDTKSLTVGKTYKYRVRAVEQRLFSKDYSSWVTVSAKPSLSKVKSLKVASRTHNSIKLKWGKVDGASGYEVQMYNGGKWKSYKKTTGTSLTVSGLTLGKTYQFRVRAYRTVSGKAVNGAFSSTVKSSTYLKAPSTFVLKGVTTSTLKLAWSSVSGAKGYEVYNTVTKKWTDAKTNKSLTVKKLSPGKEYGFIVRAYSGSYDGTKSKTRYFTTTPSKPAGFTVNDVKSTTITFSWNAVTGADGYQPAVKDPETGKVTYLSTTTETTATASGLASNKKYTVLVRAFVKNSNVKDISATAYSSWASASETTLPPAPSSVKLTQVTENSLKLLWAKSAGATGYEYFNPVLNDWVGTGASTSVTVNGLAAGTKYTFKVRALLNGKAGSETKAYSFITTPPAPVLTVKDVIDSVVTVNWDKISGATGYYVYVKNGADWELFTTTTNTSAILTGIDNETSPVKVQAYAKNSNVKNIDAITKSDFSREITQTDYTVSASSTANNNIILSWTAHDGAVAYSIEKYDSYERDWMVYDFDSNSWTFSQYLDEDSVTTTTELTFTDKLKDSARTSGDVYRVTGIDANGNASVSKYVNGFTKDLEGFTVNNYSVTINLPDYDKYNIYARDHENMPKLILTTTDKKVKLNFAPSSYQAILVIGEKGGLTTKATNWITFRTKDLKIVKSSDDSNYNASVNSQLLFLANSINNTKAYQDKITVKNKTDVSYEINQLKLVVLGVPWINAKTTEEVESSLNKYDDGDSISAKESQKLTTTITFENGKSTTSKYSGVKLNEFIEPTSDTSSSSFAYLYNSLTSQSEWKEGFKDVSTTKNSDGTYTVKATIKQESKVMNYHNGFITSLNLTEFSKDGFEISSFKVGATTLEAVIDSEGYLKSYKASSPYSASMKAEFSSSEGLANMSMSMKGNTAFNYTITR